MNLERFLDFVFETIAELFWLGVLFVLVIGGLTIWEVLH